MHGQMFASTTSSSFTMMHIFIWYRDSRPPQPHSSTVMIKVVAHAASFFYTLLATPHYRCSLLWGRGGEAPPSKTNTTTTNKQSQTNKKQTKNQTSKQINNKNNKTNKLVIVSVILSKIISGIIITQNGECAYMCRHL